MFLSPINFQFWGIELYSLERFVMKNWHPSPYRRWGTAIFATGTIFVKHLKKSWGLSVPCCENGCIAAPIRTRRLIYHDKTIKTIQFNPLKFGINWRQKNGPFLCPYWVLGALVGNRGPKWTVVLFTINLKFWEIELYSLECFLMKNGPPSPYRGWVTSIFAVIILYLTSYLNV